MPFRNKIETIIYYSQYKTKMNSKTSIKTLTIFCLITLLIACSPSTQLRKTWTDPSVSGSTFKPFKKVLVVARLKDESGNRIAEDKMAAQFKKGVAVQSYSYLLASDTVQGAVDARLQKDGFDGLVLMRLTDMEKSLNVQNNSYGGYYGGYYGRYYGAPYGYGGTTVTEDKEYIVETTIYSLVDGKLLWSGTTSTLNPTSLGQSIDDIIYAVKTQLFKQGLIKQETP